MGIAEIEGDDEVGDKEGKLVVGMDVGIKVDVGELVGSLVGVKSR